MFKCRDPRNISDALVSLILDCLSSPERTHSRIELLAHTIMLRVS